jgi:hypothetical protein
VTGVGMPIASFVFRDSQTSERVEQARLRSALLGRDRLDEIVRVFAFASTRPPRSTAGVLSSCSVVARPTFAPHGGTGNAREWCHQVVQRCSSERARIRGCEAGVSRNLGTGSADPCPAPVSRSHVDARFFPIGEGR